MVIYAAVDDHMGMTFNHRRQSQDKAVREMILNETKTGRLWMNPYTKKQFDDPAAEQIIVDEDFLEKAEEEDYCFVENVDINELQDNISKIYVYKWNRKYPSDVTFPVAMLDNYQLENVSEFEGNSHDKITEEIYIRSKV